MPPLTARQRKARLEVHSHSFIRGPRSRFAGLEISRVVHSHEGGDAQHQHPDTGPAAYTIDKDDWARATGLKGGGRKKFTARPTGEQMELVAVAPGSLDFDIIIDESALARFHATEHGGPSVEGGGIGTAARLALGNKLRPHVRVVKAGSR